MCTIAIEAVTPLFRTSRINLYKNIARSRLFCRIAKRSISCAEISKSEAMRTMRTRRCEGRVRSRALSSFTFSLSRDSHNLKRGQASTRVAHTTRVQEPLPFNFEENKQHSRARKESDRRAGKVRFRVLFCVL